MFDNIGGKIKSLAQVVCWIGIIASVICGFILIGTDEDLILLGLLIMVIGSLISWVSSFALYGFGQLIENTDELCEWTRKSGSNKKSKGEKAKSQKEETYTEEDFLKEFGTQQKSKPQDFNVEIQETDTSDLELILKDQGDLYTEEELKLIEKELKSRQQH